MKKKNIFIINALVLAAGSILSKVLGAFYRVPLTNILGESGMGIYQSVFPLFSFLLIITTSGVPVALTKLIAASEKTGDRSSQKIYFWQCFIFVLFLSFVFAGLICLLSGVLARMQGTNKIYILFISISPCFMFASLTGVLRAYFQGRQCMLPSSFSQITEQLVKLILGILFAKMLLPRGLVYGVLGAILGVVISEVVAFIFIVLCFILRKKQKITSDAKPVSKKEARKQLFKIAMRSTLLAAVVPLVFMIDSFLILHLLRRAGLTVNEATQMYGSLYGVVHSLINMPVVLAIAIAAAIMPAISGEKSDCVSVNKKISLAMKLCVLIALPCFVVMVSMPREIFAFLYQRGSGAFILATRLLTFSAVQVLFVSLLAIFSSILQGLGDFTTPLKNILFAATIKTVLTVVLVPVKTLNIYGAVIAFCVFYFIAALLNFIKIARICKIKIMPIRILFALLSAAGMFGLIKLFSKLFLSLSANLHAILTISAAGLVYLMLIFSFKLLCLKELR